MDTKEIYMAMLAAEREGAKLILHAHNVLTEEKSGHRDVVTEYDKKVQDLLVERLSEAVPGAKFFCEENDVREELDAEHLFVIDPIDGTMNFVKGYCHSCSSVAYLHKGELTAAAIYNPYLDEMFSAICGEGAWLNAKPIHAAQSPLSDNIFALGSSPYRPDLADETFRLARLAFDASLDLRRGASAALDLAYIAAGRVGLFFEQTLGFWDYAAGMLLVQEAGGVCTRIDGSPLPLDGSKPSVLAGGKQAYEDFRKLL